jgi:hypothetical protein
LARLPIDCAGPGAQPFEHVLSRLRSIVAALALANAQLRSTHIELRSATHELMVTHDELRFTNSELRTAHMALLGVNEQLRASVTTKTREAPRLDTSDHEDALLRFLGEARPRVRRSA